MNPIYCLASLTVLAVMAEATFLVATTGTTVGLGTAYAATALAGVVGLVLGAKVVGAAALSKRRRGRRDLSAEALRREDLLFDVVAATDTYGCALKLVCSIEAKPESQLQVEDQLILALFGRQPETVSEDQVATPRQAYFYAANLGANQGAHACQQVFHTCKYSYNQMINYIRALRG
uniref:Uncharacterized protein n=1 Tax=Parasacculina yatsui TaxID=2836420 RepID=A0A386AVS6_9CRUS|nr:hypothetical protein [Parasacculina yatsui]